MVTPSPRDPNPVSFRTPAAFRRWLGANHQSATELIVRVYRVHAAEKGVIYSQALDEALCYGWIDGLRRRLDADSFSIRFTPRKLRSIWSKVNVAHVERLQRAGRMTRAGEAAFERRDEARTGIYSFERATVVLAPKFKDMLRANRAAWKYFQQEAPSYRQLVNYWVMSAKREETRRRRLEILIACSADGMRIPSQRAS